MSMGSYTQPFAAEAAWYYAGMRGPYVPVAPQQFFPQHPDQPWSPESTSQPTTAPSVAVPPYDDTDASTSFGPPEGAYGPGRVIMPPGTVSESSTPGHCSSNGHSLEPRRIRIKRIRTACEECRKRKQRCDGSESCAACEEQGTVCRYRDVPPAKKDPTMEKILELAKEHTRNLESLTQGVNSLQKTLRGIEARLARRK